jgi:hypothetical protein
MIIPFTKKTKYFEMFFVPSLTTSDSKYYRFLKTAPREELQNEKMYSMFHVKKITMTSIEKKNWRVSRIFRNIFIFPNKECIPFFMCTLYNNTTKQQCCLM